jgi:hypothetical protein
LGHALKNDGAEADAISGVDDGRSQGLIRLPPCRLPGGRGIANVVDEKSPDSPAAFGWRLRELSPCNREHNSLAIGADTISGSVLFSTLPSLDPDVASH